MQPVGASPTRPHHRVPHDSHQIRHHPNPHRHHRSLPAQNDSYERMQLLVKRQEHEPKHVPKPRTKIS